MCAEGLSVNGCEADYTFVLLSKGFEFFSELSALFWGLGENVGEWDASLNNGYLNRK